MLTDTEINNLIYKIAERFQPIKVIVFGSYAKGKATYKSDLDLFIVKDSHLPMKQRAGELQPMVSNLLVPVDIHVYTPEEVEEYGSQEYSFVHSVLKTGKVYFERI